MPAQYLKTNVTYYGTPIVENPSLPDGIWKMIDPQLGVVAAGNIKASGAWVTLQHAALLCAPATLFAAPNVIAYIETQVLPSLRFH